MTGNELVQKAIAISGLPARKNKRGIGALHWLAIQLDVNPRTPYRWVLRDNVPQWAIDDIYELEQRKKSITTEVA